MPGSRCPVRVDERVVAQIPGASTEAGFKRIGGGYYDWLDRPLSQWAREESRLAVEIRAADKRTRAGLRHREATA